MFFLFNWQQNRIEFYNGPIDENGTQISLGNWTARYGKPNNNNNNNDDRNGPMNNYYITSPIYNHQMNVYVYTSAASEQFGFIAELTSLPAYSIGSHNSKASKLNIDLIIY